MRVYIALSTIVITLCYMDRGDDTPEVLRDTDTPRPEWQKWLIATFVVVGALIGLAALMAWLNPTP